MRIIPAVTKFRAIRSRMPSCGPSTSSCKEKAMSDKDKVWPTGLTEAESQEIHRNLIQGTQIFGMIAALAHLLAFIYSPWLK
jgi:light-harvesting protein B-800-850 beta chain